MKSSKTDAPVIQNFGVDYLPQPFVDASTEGTTYYGWAPIGTDEGEDGWLIMKETVDSGITKRLYAQGSMEFKSAWSKRTTYSYSR